VCTALVRIRVQSDSDQYHTHFLSVCPLYRNWFTQRPAYDYIMGYRMSGICTTLVTMSEPLQDSALMYYRYAK